MAGATLDSIVQEFGVAVGRKLGRGGNPEDQLRGPTEVLLRSLGQLIGLNTVAYGEVALKELQARPDYAVDVGGVGSGGVRVGYLELKAPGRGVPPKWKPTKREREQWAKLASLPNVLYSDGTSWAHFSYGELVTPVVSFAGEFTGSRTLLSVESDHFLRLISGFLLWQPEAPRSLRDLIRIVAGLSRLLREEVAAVLSGPTSSAAYDDLTLLASDWRDFLFPDLDDERFCDAYAQTVTFALLLARANGVAFAGEPLHEIARLLGKKHSLMGRALAVLTDSDVVEELRTIETLRRVVEAVDWSVLDDGNTDVYADLYEQFLAAYDPELRKQSGSYYTPQPVAEFMVDFVDDVLVKRLKMGWGLAADDVMVVDPAMGTGTFLVEILRSVATTVDKKQGRGARSARLRKFFQDRLVGFEIQAAPYAVAELRLHETLKGRFETEVPRTEVRFLTDALENPISQQQRLTAPYRLIGQSRAAANKIKRDARIMVVIGNPPHVENSRGKAPWIEERRRSGLSATATLRSRPSLDEFRKVGFEKYESDLYGLPWCFWRWALWKAFEAHDDSPVGVVAFLTPSSFIKGRSFAGMREYLRRTCDEGWIVDLSPEGNRPPQNTRVFGSDVGRQLCIAVFARYPGGSREKPADVRIRSLTGLRASKLDSLKDIGLDGPLWQATLTGWSVPFLPVGDTAWSSYPALSDILPWSSRGVTAGRTWIYAPDKSVLSRRWEEFQSGNERHRRGMFVESRDRKLGTIVAPLPGYPGSQSSLEEAPQPEPMLVPIAYRSFDRQWVMADSRLMVMPRPPLWSVRSSSQIYVTEQSNHAICTGPGLTFTDLVPDLHHFNARSGRVYPLYRDERRLSASGNVTEGLLEYVAKVLGKRSIPPVEILAYIAGVVSSGGYSRRFAQNLEIPGVRIPITRERKLWDRAVRLGEEVLWLHTFGERCVDSSKGRSAGSRAIAERYGPRVIAGIPDSLEGMPIAISYDSDNEALLIGEGVVGPVGKDVYEYDVGGMRVVRHWFDYRSGNPRSKRRSSVLDDMNCETWTPTMTDELLALLGVLWRCIDLEGAQHKILSMICEGPLITALDLEAAGVFPVSEVLRKAPRVDVDDQRLF